ncbi:MAG: DUF736 domain-containing protein [Alphaproteobacteria bacterium]|nr:DUF736 domain-containing protein [Alphaproteobacteria bacterium]
MATIGTFIKQENGSFTGSLATLTVRARIDIKPIEKTSDKAPDFRVFAGDTEIGAAWSTTSKDNNRYLSVKLDDISFPAPILCRLVKSDKGYALVWSR